MYCDARATRDITFCLDVAPTVLVPSTQHNALGVSALAVATARICRRTSRHVTSRHVFINIHRLSKHGSSLNFSRGHSVCNRGDGFTTTLITLRGLAVVSHCVMLISPCSALAFCNVLRAMNTSNGRGHFSMVNRVKAPRLIENKIWHN
jgi:hypothetical protein